MHLVGFIISIYGTHTEIAVFLRSPKVAYHAKNWLMAEVTDLHSDVQGYFDHFWANLKNYENRLLAFTCLYVCQHVTTWLPLAGFS